MKLENSFYVEAENFETSETRTFLGNLNVIKGYCQVANLDIDKIIYAPTFKKRTDLQMNYKEWNDVYKSLENESLLINLEHETEIYN